MQGRRVVVVYSSRNLRRAAILVKRLRSLGAEVVSSALPYVPPDQEAHLQYSFGDYRAATSIEAALADIVRLRLNSTSATVDLTLSLY
jgi:hypothetical protein